VGGRGARALIGDQVDVAADVADEQVELAGAAPVAGEHRRGTAKVDGLAVLVLNLDARGVLALALALEEIQLAGPAAGKAVHDAVAVESDELWSEAYASPRGDSGFGAAGREPGEFAELRLGLGAFIAVDAKLAVAELADEQVHDAVPGKIGYARRGMADIH